MSWYLLLQTLVAGAVVILVAFLISAVIQLRITLKSVDKLARNVDDELVPLLKKAHTTLNEVNSELSRVDGIVNSIQEVSDRVQNTTDAAKKLVATPAVKMAGILTGARVALANLVHRREK